MSRAIRKAKPYLAYALFLAFLLFVKANVGQAAYIPSGSMIPTLNIHDVLIIDKMVKPEDLKFGDIVVFQPPEELNLDKILIKRLIGLPGDTIEVRDGKLYRNGKAVEEPYLNETMTYRMAKVVVPEGSYFFLGDNRNRSNDSHLWPTPFVPASSIIGKAVYRVFPFNHMEGV
ncbi:signal peptidase I [Paenibacillus aurantius]|uniref:Signal peptidase I n=1 Tax=Paenibacillus aurantius TaxID=2918900 RepID=A0AA96RE48_9BACL|nr:signal peptidase I [Paenibacillus aurantius]WNQ09793.1 signal peptidase I [Paenibacillus aurantius]